MIWYYESYDRDYSQRGVVIDRFKITLAKKQRDKAKRNKLSMKEILNKSSQ